MSDNIIKDAATKIFGDLCEPRMINDAEEGIWPTELWDTLEESAVAIEHIFDAGETARNHGRRRDAVARRHAAEIEGFFHVLDVARPA